MSRDKLGEAQFFLDRLQESKANRQAFRYYLSAFLSAARSITFALQSDYRGKHGDKFDSWYRHVAEQLRANRIARMIHEARNTFLHQGNRLYYRKLFNTPEGELLTIDYDTKFGRIKFQYTPPKEDGRVKLDPNQPTDIQENEIVARLSEKWIHRIVGIIQSIEGKALQLETLASLLPDEHHLPFDELLGELHAYITVMSTIVQDAENLFGSDWHATP